VRGGGEVEGGLLEDEFNDVGGGTLELELLETLDGIPDLELDVGGRGVVEF